MKWMKMKKVTVSMRQQKRNLTFPLMDVMNQTPKQTQLQSTKKTWILQATGAFYFTPPNNFDSFQQQGKE